MKVNILISISLMILTCAAQVSISQSVEIQGEAKVTEMTNDNKIDEIVVRKSDGTLATRSAQSLPSSFEDTIRSLNTDFELAKHICECGTDLPPYLIESLLDAGYTGQDLIKAGVPFTNLTENLVVVDIDGNEYDVVTIGTQEWLKQNLRVTKYNDGTPIDLKVSDAEWSQSISDEEPAYCYPNGDISNVEDYGFIYSSYTSLGTFNVNKNMCPEGWKVPKNNDFNILISYLEPSAPANDNSVGRFLKEKGTNYWLAPNGGSNNLTNFSARGAGYRLSNGFFIGFNERIHMNTNELSSFNSSIITINGLFYDNQELSNLGFDLTSGSGSIRCLKE